MGYPDTDHYRDFWRAQGKWSQDTFGPDSERGPRGPLLHLQLEVAEALEAVEANPLGYDTPAPKTAWWRRNTHMEIVDCFFLVTDAARRSGLDYDEFMDLAFEKLKINQQRKWGPRVGGQPVEHIRDGEGL